MSHILLPKGAWQTKWPPILGQQLVVHYNYPHDVGVIGWLHNGMVLGYKVDLLQNPGEGVMLAFDANTSAKILALNQKFNVGFFVREEDCTVEWGAENTAVKPQLFYIDYEPSNYGVRPTDIPWYHAHMIGRALTAAPEVVELKDDIVVGRIISPTVRLYDNGSALVSYSGGVSVLIGMVAEKTHCIVVPDGLALKHLDLRDSIRVAKEIYRPAYRTGLWNGERVILIDHAEERIERIVFDDIRLLGVVSRADMGSDNDPAVLRVEGTYLTVPRDFVEITRKVFTAGEILLYRSRNHLIAASTLPSFLESTTTIVVQYNS